MSDPLRLFADDGELRPPGIPEDVRAYPGNMRRCPQCRCHTLDYMSLTYAACERRTCGYEWRRSGLLHHTEPLPF
jgi:hypothetical protein